MAFIKDIRIEVNRKLDGKGRLALPGDLREAAGFKPAESVRIRLAEVDGKTAFIITSREQLTRLIGKEDSYEQTDQRKSSL